MLLIMTTIRARQQSSASNVMHVGAGVHGSQGHPHNLQWFDQQLFACQPLAKHCFGLPHSA